MILEGLTYGENKSEEKLNIVMTDYIGLCLSNVSVIKSLIDGTDSKDWLIASENEANKILKEWQK